MNADTRIQAVMGAITGRLSRGALMPGDKLPSLRRLAREMQVSPSTVVEAYGRLAAEGMIRSRPGSGFHVVGPVPPQALADAAPRPDRAIDPFWVSRQSLDAVPDTLRPGCGWLPPDWMPENLLRKGLRALARADTPLLTDYGPARGALALRRLLARRFATEGIEAGTEQILLTSSGTQAIDLLCRFFLKPGDAVLVDDPCYFNFQAVARANGARLVSVPYTPAGPDLARFAEVLATHRPRLYLTNAALHNPTGATLAPNSAHRMLMLAAAQDLVIVEDEIFADFEPEPSPRLAALDGLARVIRIGSFSKTLSASVRCGYIATRADWIEGLVDLQVATNFGGPSPIAAELVLHALNDGSYRTHLNGLHTRLARRRRESAAALEAMGVRPWILPRGGFYLWCRLPDGRDAADLAQAAVREQLVLAPGNVFSLTQSAPDLMRFNVAQLTPDALRILGALLKRAPALS